MTSITVKQFTSGQLNNNCYVLVDNTANSGIIIDPGEGCGEVLVFCRELKVEYILVTHCHWDHVANLSELRSLTKAKVVVHQDETCWLPVKPDVVIKEDGPLGWGEKIISVIHNPGHSPGGLSYLVAGYVFTGDTLMAGLVGPTEIPGSNRQQLIQSVKQKLFTLEEDLVVYPGHGPATTIGYEKTHNCFPRIKKFTVPKLFMGD